MIKKYKVIEHNLVIDENNEIIATINKKIDNLPLIEIPDEIKQFALQQYPKVIETGEKMKTATDFTQREAWEKGYKAAQSKYRYTEEDVINAIKMAQKYTVDTQYDEFDVMHEILKHTYSSEQIIQFLQKKKEIKSVILEMQEWNNGSVNFEKMKMNISKIIKITDADKNTIKPLQILYYD